MWCGAMQPRSCTVVLSCSTWCAWRRAVVRLGLPPTHFGRPASGPSSSSLGGVTAVSWSHRPLSCPCLTTPYSLPPPLPCCLPSPSLSRSVSLSWRPATRRRHRDGGDAATHVHIKKQDLINQLLDSDPKRRPTAEDVLKHPWMQKTANLSRRPMVHVAENLRGFHRGRMRLKACLLAVMSGLAGPDTYASDPKSTVGSRTGALKWMDVGGKVFVYCCAVVLCRCVK